MVADQSRTAIELTGPDFRDFSIDILERGQTLRFRARGSSMIPWIRNGDLLTVEPVERRKVRLGDVVFYRGAADRIIVHRVVKAEGRDGTGRFLLRGDSLARPDGWFSLSDVLGVVVALERHGRRIELARGPARWAQHLWFGLSPFTVRLYAFLARLRRRL